MNKSHSANVYLSNMAYSLYSVRKVDLESDLDLAHFKTMTMKYLQWLAEDLCYQGIDEELQQLPGSFSEDKGGTMILAVDNATQRCIGAVALRALAGKQTEGLDEVIGLHVNKLCEMKRLFVVPEYHGKGVGKALAVSVLEEAQRLGYQGMVLDTLERLTSANKLYAHLGFKTIDPYNFCPLGGVMYWGLCFPNQSL